MTHALLRSQYLISTLHFSLFFDHKFMTFTTNLTLLYASWNLSGL